VNVTKKQIRTFLDSQGISNSFWKNEESCSRAVNESTMLAAISNKTNGESEFIFI
jgi:hypothetical protein